MNQKPDLKRFIMMFIRIVVLCALAWVIVYGVKTLFGIA